MKLFKTIICVVFGLLFANAGLDKFLHHMPMPPMKGDVKALYDAFATIKWLMPLVGFVELVGGLMFIFSRTRALGALVILPIMVGIVLQNAVFFQSGLSIAVALFAINIWMILDNFSKYKHVICGSKA